MKSFPPHIPASCTAPSRLRRLGLLVPLLLTLTGCQTIRQVNKTVIAPHLMDATLDQLLASIDSRYAAIQSFTAKTDILASTGGARTGEVKEFPSLTSYIILRKPSDLYVLMQKPYVGSRAIAMSSDGKNFRLVVSLLKTSAYEGPDAPSTKPGKGGLDSLRPNIIRNALLIAPRQPDEFITEAENSRILAPAKGKQNAVEEPDYDISFLRAKENQVLEIIRVVHISRTTLLPYQQDLYQNGHIVTTVSYDNYQKFGDIDFPMSIAINRPIDEYSLKITVNKLTLNQKIDDEQFKVTFPEGTVVQKMQ